MKRIMDRPLPFWGYVELLMQDLKPLVREAILKLPWVHWLDGYLVHNEKRRHCDVAVVLVPASVCKAIYHPGVGIDRWELWIPFDWKARVYDHGLAVFVEKELLVLDATRWMEGSADLDGFDELWSLAGARPRVGNKGDLKVEVDSVFYAASLGGILGIGKDVLEAKANAVMNVERHLGNRR